MCLVAGEAAYCLRQGLYTGLVLQICRAYPDSMTRCLYTGLVLQICRAYPDSWPDVCTLDLCYRSVELTQTPWPDVCTLDLCYRSVELTQTHDQMSVHWTCVTDLWSLPRLHDQMCTTAARADQCGLHRHQLWLPHRPCLQKSMLLATNWDLFCHSLLVQLVDQI